jgi:hypothetical protein
VSRKPYLIAALAIAMMVSSGVYAATNTSGLRTVGITAPTGDWDKVDEATSDGDGTYIDTSNAAWQEDLYHTDNHTEGTGNVTSVTVYGLGRATASPTQTNSYAHIKTNGSEYNGGEQTTTANYTSFSYAWTDNPSTNTTWTWDEIDALQIGVGLREPAAGQATRCTQVYAEVEYQYLPTTGSAPTGDLFDVVEDPNYSGDLSVRVYLANTADLMKAYDELNVRLFLENSVEAGQTPNYQVLNLANGLATFTLKDPASDNHTLSVIGGNYTLVSDDTSTWTQEWTVTPEFYCEATQR